MKVHTLLILVLLAITINSYSISTVQALTPYLLYDDNIDGKTVEINYGQYVSSDAKSISVLIYLEVYTGDTKIYSFVTVENEVDTHFNLINPALSAQFINVYSETFTIATTGSRKIVLSSPKKLGVYIITKLYFINQYK
jgi:hypothetical protein